jgi:hypothetical protein
VPDKARGAFLEAVTDAVARGRLRLLLGIRSDFSDLLLKACRDADPERRALDFDRESYYTLLPFNAEKAESVVNRMLGRDERLRLDPVTVEERNGFTRELVQELLRPPGDARLCGEDEKRVLPVELQMVGSTYETVVGERFTALELKKRGGKVGLYRDYIADAKDYVFRKTGVGGDTALAVLRRLISPAGTKWAQSAGAIAAACGGLSAKEVDEVLRAFAERRPIVSRTRAMNSCMNTWCSYCVKHPNPGFRNSGTPRRDCGSGASGRGISMKGCLAKWRQGQAGGDEHGRRFDHSTDRRFPRVRFGGFGVSPTTPRVDECYGGACAGTWRGRSRVWCCSPAW